MVSYSWISLIVLKIHFVVIFFVVLYSSCKVWPTLLNFGSIPLIIQSSTVWSIHIGHKRNDSAGLPRIKSVAAGWETRMLPLPATSPPIRTICMLFFNDTSRQMHPLHFGNLGCDGKVGPKEKILLVVARWTLRGQYFHLTAIIVVVVVVAWNKKPDISGDSTIYGFAGKKYVWEDLISDNWIDEEDELAR